MQNQLVASPGASAAALPINSVQDLQTLGGILAQSNLFGKRNPAEGLAIVAMCQQKRISWLDFMQTFHMIQGVVSKKTDAIIADFHRLGGVHKVIARTPEKAEALFRLGETEYTSAITWQDCLVEPFVYVGKEQDVVATLARGGTPPLKSKYATPRARMQMLWARCVSDGIRVVAPECVQGIYTPEETDDFAAPPPAAPVQVQGRASPSPLSDLDVCPVGNLAGSRWDSLDTPVLQSALNATSPFITTEMKDRIRAILAAREAQPAAPQTAETETAAAESEVSNVSHA